jgi:ankyrin repeat protein
MSAASLGNTEAIRFLVSHGAELNRISQLQYGGSTALTTAVSVGQAESVRTLLELGADARLKMKDGATALSKAQASGNADVLAQIRAALAKPARPSRR